MVQLNRLSSLFNLSIIKINGLTGVRNIWKCPSSGLPNRTSLLCSAPFGHLLALPKDGFPVESWVKEDEAWTDVAKGIRKVVEELM